MRNLKRALFILLAMAIVSFANISSISEAAAFSDVASNAWYYEYVNRLVSLKITAGIGNNKYGPNNSVTRAEFVTFLCKAIGLTQIEGYTYKDTQNHWSSKWLSAAVEANFIDKNTEFYPNKAITRQEAVEMLCRSINLEESTENTSPYSDVKSEIGYSNRAFEEYLMLGSVVNGQRYFYPLNNIKRSEVAAVIVNLVDYIADAESYKAAKIAELDQKEQKAREEKEEAERYAAWKESVKHISPELLNNTQGLYKGSVYESNKYLIDQSGYLSGWGKDYGMTEEEFADEIVRVGSKFLLSWYNADYTKIDKLKVDLKDILETNTIKNSLQDNLDYIKNNKFIAEGKFYTSKGLIVCTDSGSLGLRGTIKFRYLKPTSTNVLSSEIVSGTGKIMQVGVWYEQDYQVSFYPEKIGLKTTAMHAISKVRISQIKD
ncbi:S-layer homology domain-containing protein [Ruminiclostridium herbifermentans]|uniref:S-layer homology domain-containing protein n=1 Tax=Ruminiclostridium herbifermentans TaxID=2488810 RepID=A0A4U7JJT4_9FIRM|nr:S-layer homology domain-containing protein [Ruminiclostridium herbifermentans]QNU68308.1 S-layer homology domain-containing protein [Ruminiclostridium herbifermentans]